MNEISGHKLVSSTATIHSKVEFIDFLEKLVQNSIEHPEEWENTSITQFLEGMKEFLKSIDSYYANFRIALDSEVPNWRTFADILLAGRVYE